MAARVGFEPATLRRSVNPGGLGVATPEILGRGSWGSQGFLGVVDGSLNIIISYNVLEVCSKVATFKEK